MALESIYAVVFLNGLHCYVSRNGQIVKRAISIAVGIDLDGRNDVLGLWINENGSANCSTARRIEVWRRFLSPVPTI